MQVDPGYSRQLQAEALFAKATPTGAPAWGDLAIETTVTSAIYLASDALTEAQRQADFLGGPLAQDSHVVPGARRDLMLKPITLINSAMGYAAGVACFVIGVAEQPNFTTILTVIRRL